MNKLEPRMISIWFVQTLYQKNLMRPLWTILEPFQQTIPLNIEADKMEDSDMAPLCPEEEP